MVSPSSFLFFERCHPPGDEMLHFIVLLFNSYNNERGGIQTLVLSKLYIYATKLQGN